MRTERVEKKIGKNMYRGETQYVDEPISNNIGDSINDFYNMMHLIRNSWTNKDYKLEMGAAGYTIYDKYSKLAGYDIYNKNGEFVAWIGISEKSQDLTFVIMDSDRVPGSTGFGYNQTIYKKAIRGFKDSMEVDEDENWIYSRLKIKTIVKYKTEKRQREIVKDWIDKIAKKIL